MKVVIIGGVAAGAAAAARLRRLDENAEIIIIEKTNYISYANCGLPYYVGNTIKEKGELTLQTPQSFKMRFNIDARVNQEVVEINRKDKKLSIKKLGDGSIYEESYDKLILAPGAKAKSMKLENMDKNKTFTVKTVEDAVAVEYYLRTHDVNTAVVIGGGFIGIEMAENLRKKCAQVYVAVRGNQILSNFDYDMAIQVEARMRQLGVATLKDMKAEDYEEIVKRADIVIMAVGVEPQAELAEKAGLQITQLGTIEVNEHMQTSDPDIYAGGDAVAVTNKLTGEKAKISLAGPAAKQGRIIADNLAGIDSKYEGSTPISILKIFDITAASCGLNEKEAKKRGFDVEKVILSSASHATYYPGATSMFTKLIFDKTTGKVLGAQIVGMDGVDKRIDIISTAMFAGIKVNELKKLDLAYAPPYSSAKDPVNMAGFIAENVITGKMKQFFVEDVKELEGRDDIVLLDTRTAMEYGFGHFKNSLNIPVDELRERIGELEAYKSKAIYVNCHSGLRSYVASRILVQNGFDCYNLAGGYAFYDYFKGASEYDIRSRRECGLPID